MTRLRPGLREQLVTRELERELEQLAARLEPHLGQLDAAEAPDRIALHLATLVERAIASLPAARRVQQGVALASAIVGVLAGGRGTGVAPDAALLPDGAVLRGIAQRLPTGAAVLPQRPATPLLDTTLLTNAPGEPGVGFQVRSEIDSADAIDVIMAFVRRSGIRGLLDDLRRHCEAGRPLRLLTTTYTGSTEARALQDLQDLGAQVRVSYDTTRTRLHAKAWLFTRASGLSTAFVGSSNLTHSAQVTGMEWNVRLSAARNRDVIDKIAAVFTSYWESDDFRPFDADEFAERTRGDARGPDLLLSPVEIRPEPFQERILEQVALERERGRHRNLIVAATGTGKTVMAALDYQRLRASLPRARLLFVAHRQEILQQSLATFRHALRDAAFGELWVGRHKPSRFEHVFASIQSLRNVHLEDLPPRHFDVVIIDEFHHAAAPSYTRLLDHLQPRELLGLTATPERADGRSVLDWFDGRIAAELRLWDAIEQQRLAPFAYFGVSDGVDYRKLKWVRGRGYDSGELSTLVTGDTILAGKILLAVERWVPDPHRMRALGFCVSVEHAHFMATQFKRAGVAARAVTGDSPEAERRGALEALEAGTLQVLFAVDLFNEGVDLPRVDTILMLRPTDSATIFIQQLGRGLRRHAEKEACTVLDFIGLHRREFRLDVRFAAMLGCSRGEVERQLKAGFPFLPGGSEIQLDPVAQEAVFRSLRDSLPLRWNARTREAASLLRERPGLRLAQFLHASGLSLEEVYDGSGRGWSDLKQAAGAEVLPAGPAEAALRRAVGRLLHVDDPLRISGWRRWLRGGEPPAAMDLPRRRILHMLAATLLDKVKSAPADLDAALDLIRRHPQVCSELLEVLEVLEARVGHLTADLAVLTGVPLRVHARYTRREILAAFADGWTCKVPLWQAGVLWLPKAGADLLTITFDKTSDHFSPTTRYRDYAISRTRLHWESQSTTRAGSTTGRRYQNHEAEGSLVLPFARHDRDERAFWFLGPARYLRHEGERPMAITWELAHPLPGDLFTSFAAAVA